MIGIAGGSHFASASFECLAIQPGSLCQSLTFIFGNRTKLNEMKSGELAGRGMIAIFVEVKRLPYKECCRQTCCCSAGPENCCAIGLDVCARCFPSAISEHCNRNFNSWSVVEQILYVGWLQYKKTNRQTNQH
jgi:hypothetical protein